MSHPILIKCVRCTVITYDGLGCSLGTVTYQDQSTNVLTTSYDYRILQGLQSFTVDTTMPFELVTTKDAYNHQTISYSDSLGRHRYYQLFTGTSPSTLVPCNTTGSPRGT